MTELLRMVPTPEDLLEMEVEDLAAIIMETRASFSQRPGFTIDGIRHQLYPLGRPGYPPATQSKVLLAIADALNWLQGQGLIMLNPGQPATWYMATRKGETIRQRGDLDVIRKAGVLDRNILHARIIEAAWPPFQRGKYGLAITAAYREVELAVREACLQVNPDFRKNLIGKNLIDAAFATNTGSLTDKELEPGEQEGMRFLFLGGIRFTRNISAHHDEDLTPEFTAKAILGADFLLDILDERVEALTCNIA